MALTVKGGGRLSLGDGDHDVYGPRAVNIQAGVGINHFDLLKGGSLTLAGTDTVTLRGGILKLSEAGHALVTMIGGGGATVDQGAITLGSNRSVNTFQPVSGHTTMSGGGSTDIFRFDARGISGNHTIEGFQSGIDKLLLLKHSLATLQSHGEIQEVAGNTLITMHGGSTTIELVGVTGVLASSFLKH